LLNGDPDGRFIEIGPADTLMSMLKKTFAQGSNGVTGEQNAEFLTFMEEIARVHKVPDMVLEEPTLPSQDIGGSGTEAVEPIKADEPIKAAIATNTEINVTTARQISEIDDVPPLASEALLAIVASALKASRASIDTANSIKLLARGMYFLAMFLTRI
jgi:3-oxoacyl-[acyl-carrier protein] reductase